MADRSRSQGHAAPERVTALEAVLFDAGGTLVRLDFEWMSETLRELGLAIDAAALRRAEVEGRKRYDQSWGGADAGPAPLGRRGDVRAYFGGTLEQAGVPPQRVPEIVARFLEREKSAGLWVRPAEGAREALEAVGAMGLRRAVVSNSDGRAEWHLRHTGVHEGIEFVVDSGIVGIEKPQPRVFHIALERLGVEPRRALYVGDIRSVDEVGARAAGMHFVLIDPSGSYGAPEGPAIREIRELPDWIAARARERYFSREEPSC
jgi:HAD superfamily hydrolase (TIGR01509 family)